MEQKEQKEKEQKKKKPYMAPEVKSVAMGDVRHDCHVG